MIEQIPKLIIEKEDTIDELFTWKDTPEKQDFWANINDGDFKCYYEIYNNPKIKNIL